jgi:radical SAM protein with 4Fe4S-binding SPASM domain
MQAVLKRSSNRLRLLSSYLFGSDLAVSGPLDVLAEVTSHCNLACPECRRLELVEKPGHMQWHVFESILHGGSDHLELAFLFGWGEPLLWPNLIEGIQLARKLKIRTSISTNITMLKGELARRIARCGPDILTLALDSHVKQVYEHYRKGADFDEVHRNLSEFIRISREHRNRSQLVLQMICSPDTSGKSSGYETFARQFPRTEIRFRRYRPAQPSPESTANRRRPCPVIWRGPAYVREDGEVFPCCILLDRPLGNILHSDLKTLWNSEKMRVLRQIHSSGRINEIKECSGCYHSDPREYSRLTVLAGFLWSSYWVRRLIPLSERLLVMKNRIKSSLQFLAGLLYSNLKPS